MESLMYGEPLRRGAFKNKAKEQMTGSVWTDMKLLPAGSCNIRACTETATAQSTARHGSVEATRSDHQEKLKV